MQALAATSTSCIRHTVHARLPGRPQSRPLLARPLHSSNRATTVARAFGKGGDKEDAARKALQDAFKGKKDPFQAAEERAKKRAGSGGGGGGGGSGGGGGGGGGFGGFDFGDWFDGFKRGSSALLKTLATMLLFAAALGALALWQPLLRLMGQLVRAVFRLDGNPRAQLAQQQAMPQVDLSKKEGLGNVEEAVISKYAAAYSDEDEGDDGKEEQ